MQRVLVLLASLLLPLAAAHAQTGFAGKLDRQRAILRYVRQGCGTGANSTNFQTLAPTAAQLTFPGGFSCESFVSDNITMSWTVPTGAVNAAIPADNATTVALVQPGSAAVTVAVNGTAGYNAQTSESHSFYSRATLKEFTGGACATAERTVNENLQGVNTANLSVTATCPLNQAKGLTIVPGSVVKQNNQVASFEAALTFETNVDLAHGNQFGSGGWRGGVYTITVEAIYKFAVTADYGIDHIEVVQVTQTADNRIPLVADKYTIARVFAKLVSGDTEPVRGVPMILRAFRNGAELPDSPQVNTLGATETWRAPARTSIAHGFRLPDAWRTAGTIELRAEINPDRTLEEPNYNNNTGSVQATFVTKPGLALRYVPVCFEVPGLPKTCPTNLAGSFDYLIPQLFPVAESKYSYQALAVPEQVYPRALTNWAWRSAFLRWVSRLDQSAQTAGDTFDNLIAWVPDGYAPGLLGLARFKTGSGGRVSLNVADDSSQHLSALTVAHELGHNYDLHHTAQEDSCGSKDAGTDWPYPVSLIREIGISGNTARLYPPDTYQDIMSYCYKQWIAPFHYLKLFNGGVVVPGTAAAKGFARGAAPTDYWVLTGEVERTAARGVIDPVLPVRSTLEPTPAAASGSFCLLLQAGSTTAASYCFTPEFRDGSTGEQTEVDSFDLRVPILAGVTKISLQKSGVEIASRTLSANAPTVQWLLPSAAETWPDATPRTLRWQGADADADALVFHLSYSTDNGVNWLPLAIDHAASEYTLDPSRIQGGAQVRFRVTASDGFRSTSAEVGPINVQQRPAIAVTGSPVDLGVATIGATETKSILVRNSGNGPLRIDRVTSSSPKFAPLPPALPVLVPAGGAISLRVAYTPGTAGADNATITVASNASGQETFPFLVRATGVDGKKPRIAVDPGSVAFRPTPAGAKSSATLTILNPSLVTLNASWRVEGTGFRLTGATAQAAIGAGAQRDVAMEFEPTAAGKFTANLIVTSDDPDRPTLTIPLRAESIAAAVEPQGPRIGTGGVVDAAQFQAVVSPGGIGSIFGSELAAGVVGATTVPLPKLLGNVRVFFHGVDAPLFFVSPNQINFQVPFEARPGTTAQVIVQRDTTQTAPEAVRVEEFAPAVFLNAATKDPIATRFPDNSVITAGNPAKPGDVLIVYLTGVGGLTSVPTTGEATPASPLPSARIDATVTLGGQPVSVLYSGLSPFFIGLAQLNIQLPATLPPGAKLPLIVRFGAATGQTVQLPVQYDAPPAPVIQVSPASINFGDVAVGQSLQRAVTITNAGTANLTILEFTSSNPRFAASVALPLTLSPGATRDLFVNFQPTNAAVESGTLTIRSNDAATPQATVTLAGRGTAGGGGPSTGTPAMTITPASLAFGDTGVGVNKDLNLTIRNTGTGALVISSIAASQPSFSMVGSSTLTILAGAEQVIAIRFAPTAAGLVTGVLTINSNDPARPAFTVPVTGTGFLTGAQTLVLQIDDGTFERTVTIPDTTELHFINRITPPRYPATLKAIRIYFPVEGLVTGDTFTLLSAAHASGTADIGTPSFRTGNGRVSAIGEFVEFAVPEITINSGDFLVGFATPIAPGQRPMAVDISGYQGRSYVSSNGSLFQPVHIRSAASQGNFAIRAVVGVQ